MKLFKKCELITVIEDRNEVVYNITTPKIYNYNGIVKYAYIISDDKLKKDDWAIFKNEDGDFKIKKVINDVENNSNDLKKIIATNNRYLELPKIPINNIEYFFEKSKNNEQTDIRVEYDRSYSGWYDENDIWHWDEHKLKINSENYINILTVKIEQI